MGIFEKIVFSAEKKEVEIDKIVPLFERIDLGDIESLKQSIERTRKEPVHDVVLVQSEDKYICISGWRRVQALKKLGKKTITAKVCPFMDEESMYKLCHEANREQKEFVAVEYGKFYREMMRKLGWGQEKLAKELFGDAKKQPTIANYVMAYDLYEELRKSLSPQVINILITQPLYSWLALCKAKKYPSVLEKAINFLRENPNATSTELHALIDRLISEIEKVPESKREEFANELAKRFTPQPTKVSVRISKVIQKASEAISEKPEISIEDAFKQAEIRVQREKEKREHTITISFTPSAWKIAVIYAQNWIAGIEDEKARVKAFIEWLFVKFAEDHPLPELKEWHTVVGK